MAAASDRIGSRRDEQRAARASRATRSDPQSDVHVGRAVMRAAQLADANPTEGQARARPLKVEDREDREQSRHALASEDSRVLTLM